MGPCSDNSDHMTVVRCGELWGHGKRKLLVTDKRATLKIKEVDQSMH